MSLFDFTPYTFRSMVAASNMPAPRMADVGYDEWDRRNVERDTDSGYCLDRPTFAVAGSVGQQRNDRQEIYALQTVCRLDDVK